MAQTDPILYAHVLSGPSRGLKPEGNAAISAALHDDDLAWLHLGADHPAADDWIDRHLSWLDPAIRDALTEPQTRPRALPLGDGVLLILRGINSAQGADPEDMVSVRLYVDPARVVSLSRRPLAALEEMDAQARAGQAPDRSGAFLSELVERLTDRIEAQVADLEERADELEARVIARDRGELRGEIADQRLELTDLRRFLTPQRDAVRELTRGAIRWLTEGDVRRLGEQLDQMTRVTETLEALREQLHTISDEIEGARADRLNRNLYVLSVISAVFLPLGFLTGLMGINLDGMPGAAWDPAFWTFTLGLTAVAGAVLALLRLFDIL